MYRGASAGATGSPEDVRLVLVSAPIRGDPHESEAHSETGPLDSVNEYAYRCFRDGNVQLSSQRPHDPRHGALPKPASLRQTSCGSPGSAWHSVLVLGVLGAWRSAGDRLSRVQTSIPRACSSRSSRTRSWPPSVPRRETVLWGRSWSHSVCSRPPRPLLPGCNLPGAKASWQAIADRVHERDELRRG